MISGGAGIRNPRLGGSERQPRVPWFCESVAFMRLSGSCELWRAYEDATPATLVFMRLSAPIDKAYYLW